MSHMLLWAPSYTISNTTNHTQNLYVHRIYVAPAASHVMLMLVCMIVIHTSSYDEVQELSCKQYLGKNKGLT